MTNNNDIDYKYIENSVIEWVNNYEIDNNCKIVDMKRNQYNYILIQLYENVIKHIYICCLDPTNQNLYSIPDDIIIYICKVYIQICYLYNKNITIMGYSYIIGVNYQSITDKSNKTNNDYMYIDTITNKSILYRDLNKYTDKYKNRAVVRISNNAITQTYKDIVNASEHSLSESATDGNIGALAMGKIKHGWIEGKDNQLKAILLEQSVKPSAMLEDYKRLYITQKHNNHDKNT